MSDIQLYLLEADQHKPEASEIAKRTAKRMLHTSEPLLEDLVLTKIGNTGLETKELKLIEIIESLGEYLNHEESSLRAKSKRLSNIPTQWSDCVAMSYLAEVLQATPSKVLTLQQSKSFNGVYGNYTTCATVVLQWWLIPHRKPSLRLYRISHC